MIPPSGAGSSQAQGRRVSMDREPLPVASTPIDRPARTGAIGLERAPTMKTWIRAVVGGMFVV